MNNTEQNESVDLFRRENIRLGLPSVERQNAVIQTGELLLAGGYVTQEYIPSMVERDRDLSVYMGEGLAIPHCTSEGKKYINQSGIVLLQYPDGIRFDNELAYILIGIAGLGEDHMGLLQKVAATFMEADEATLDKLFHTNDIDYVYSLFA